MHQAQCTQWFDQRQFPRVEVVKLTVTVHQFGQLAQALLPITGEHHPQILHGRPHAAVIQVDDMEHLVAAHHVAGVAITVHTDVGVRGGGVHVFNTFEQVAGH